MPSKQKIDRQKVMASLDTICPKCGCSITPDKIRRVDFERRMPGKRGAVCAEGIGVAVVAEFALR